MDDKKTNSNANNKLNRPNLIRNSRKQLQQMEKQRISEAKRIKTLLKKSKKLLGVKRRTIEFKQPVVFLMRKNGTTDFYENATSGKFEFETSDGKEREVILHPNQQTTFNYGKTSFKGYIIYEEEKIPYPHKPLLYAEIYDLEYRKLLADIMKHKAGEYTSMGKMWKNILIGLAIIIGVIVVAGLMDVNILSVFSKETTETVVNTQTGGNLTSLVLGT